MVLEKIIKEPEMFWKAIYGQSRDYIAHFQHMRHNNNNNNNDNNSIVNNNNN